MIALSTQIVLACFRKGADARVLLHADDAFLGLLNLQSPEQLSRPSKIHLALAEVATANISLVALENPEQLRRVPPEKMAAIGRGGIPVDQLMQNRRVKTASLALSDITANRAGTYGLDLRGWKRAVETASIEDYSQVAKHGGKIRRLLQDGVDVHITSDNGTDLKFKLAGRRPFLNDGVIDEEDMKAGACSIFIPSGEVSVSVDEDSAEGRFVSNVPHGLMGRIIEGVEMRFSNGKVISLDAITNRSTLKSHYGASKGQKDRIGLLSLGLNTKVICGEFFDLNRIASGSISIGIGDNRSLGGVNESEFGFLATISDGNLTIDRRSIIENGKFVDS